MSKDELRLYVDTWPWRHKYTERYYRKISEGAIRSAKEVYKALDQLGIKHNTVIDVGCGVGEWNNGNPYYYGIDNKIPKRSLIIPEDHYFEKDLEKTLYNADPKFDLCLCLEVAEHISEERADVLIEMLCKLSDRVLFSAAIPYQGGTGHINEQWQTWWERKFHINGFAACETQPDIRNNENVELWYRQNIVLYQRVETVHHWPIVEDFVLPQYYEQIVKNIKAVATI